MKVLVTYYSETGNTEKLAKAIFDAIGEAKKELAPIATAPDPEDFDLIFCGFPVMASTVPSKPAEYLKGLPEGKKVALFATHGSLRGGHLALTAFEYGGVLLSKAKFLGSFGCRGKVKQVVIDGLMNNPEHKAWAEEAQGAVTHPDSADFEDGADFARKMLVRARAS